MDEISDIFRDWEQGEEEASSLIRRINQQALSIVQIASEAGFSGNLWQSWLCWLLLTSENPFSQASERKVCEIKTLWDMALQDIEVFRALYQFDFAPIEQSLNIQTFSLLTGGESQKSAFDNRSGISVNHLQQLMRSDADSETIVKWLSTYYSNRGTGIFSMECAFRVKELRNGIQWIPIRSLEGVTLDDLVGCELQKAELRRNVEAFVDGRPFNNMLLYGDAGTGKSTSVKGLLNEYHERGLRMVEIHKYQFKLLADIIAQVRYRSNKFVIFIDDLSFEENEVEYKYLKAVIEGGLETRPRNVLICATSNRRHLIRETWNDRSDMEHNGEVHRSDTLEERLSLAARFGCTVNFNAPDRKQYHDIVRAIAQREGVSMEDEELLRQANQWELRHGGKSGRAAKQFVSYLAGEKPQK